MTPLCLTSHSLIHPQILLILLFKYILNMSTLYLLCCSRPGSIHESLWPDSLKELVCVPSPPSPHFSLLSAPQPEDPAEVRQLKSLFCSKPCSDFLSSHPDWKSESSARLWSCAGSASPQPPAPRPSLTWLLLPSLWPFDYSSDVLGVLPAQGFCAAVLLLPHSSCPHFFVSLYLSMRHLPMRSFWPPVYHHSVHFQYLSCFTFSSYLISTVFSSTKANILPVLFTALSSAHSAALVHNMCSVFIK